MGSATAGVTSAAALWLLSKFCYCYLLTVIDCVCGVLSDPRKRVWGSFGYAGLVALLGSTLSFAAHQLKMIK